MRGRAWRPWPRSIRGCYTLILGLVALLVFGAVGIGADLVVRRMVFHGVYDQALRQAQRVSTLERAGVRQNPIRTDVSQIDLIQVVDFRERILAASPNAMGRSVMSRELPGPEDSVDEISGCPWRGRSCVLGVAVHTTAEGKNGVVYAARYKPAILVHPWLEAALGAAVLLGAAGVGAISWVLVGRTFQPMHAIRAEIAELSDAGLGRRLSELPGESEIAQLARTANLTLERLERSMERQRAFASDASHELRTPIAGMRAQIEAALMYPDETDLPLALDAVLANLNRLEAIITDLLFLARLGTKATGEHERVDLSALVSEELARRRGGRVRFRADLAPGLLVDGSPVQLGRLLTNLFDNAQRHADNVVDVTVRREDDTAVLEVVDDGEGIAKEDRERVFNRFTRLDAARNRDSGGSGLGLALVRDIAEVHGGTISIEPSERGARFVLRIPAIPAVPEH